MANPNVVAVSSIYANTAVDADVAASAVSLLTCGSNKLQKINSLIIANIDGTNAATIDVWVTRSSADYYIAKTISVPADATLVVIDKNMGLYLTENDVLKIQASAAGDLSATCSYEEIEADDTIAYLSKKLKDEHVVSLLQYQELHSELNKIQNEKG